METPDKGLDASFSPPDTWEELKNLKDYLTDCNPRDLRLPADYLAYENYIKTNSQENMVQDIPERVGQDRVVLLENNFPYTKALKNLPAVQQYVLWSTKGPLTQDQIAEIIAERFPNDEWFYMERKSGYKSIPEIWHGHVFVRNS